MKQFHIMALSTILFLAVALFALNGQTPAAQSEVSSVRLPDKFAKLLQQEMRQIDEGMKQLISLISQGKATEAADIADKIHNSFILKQSLTQEELKELVSYLPKDFVQLDRTFHGNAHKLSAALRENNFQEGGALYAKMFNGCISCHSRFATDQFPGLTNN